MAVFTIAINFIFYLDRRSRLSTFFFSRDTQYLLPDRVDMSVRYTESKRYSISE